MTLREQILLLIRSKDYKGLNKEELADFYELEKADYEIFFKTLYDMEKEGLLKKLADCDILNMTPLDAMNTLYSLVKEAKRIEQEG